MCRNLLVYSILILLQVDYLTSTICSKVGGIWWACHGAKRTKCPCKLSPSPVPHISPCTCQCMHMNMPRVDPCSWYFYSVRAKCSTYLFFLLLVAVFSFKLQQFLQTHCILHHLFVAVLSLTYPKVLFSPSSTGHAKDALSLARMQEQTVQLEHQTKIKVGFFLWWDHPSHHPSQG